MAADAHDGCRAGEFGRWTRVMLDHERAHLSAAMASGFTPVRERTLIMHDIADIDTALSALDEPLKVPQ